MPRIKPHEIDKQQYDFVIVGGGTAGCVLANRLSYNSQYSILVLEAGSNTQEDLLNIKVPLFNGKIKNSPEDWQFKSTPQPEVNNRTILVPQGKILGGSSAINACLYHRCSPSDYDAWSMPGWDYKQLQPYFKKAETFHDQYQPVCTNTHGMSGPLQASQLDWNVPLAENFRKACKNYGLKEYYDISDRKCQIGVTTVQSTIFNGERSSSGSSYLNPSIQNNTANLFIGLGCKAERFILDNSKKVTHVVFSAEGNTYQVDVKREAILSTGALLSPYILLLSGIGPKAELERSGIETLVDLPGVGKNLQNHWRVPLVHETTSPEMSLHQDLFEKEDESLRLALSKKPSALTRSWPDAVAYMKIPNAPDNSSSAANTPQIELFVGGLALCRELQNLKNVNCATLLMVYVAPFSKGSVTLSGDRQLHIDLALLRDERDLECLEKGLQECMKIAQDDSYRTKCIKRWISYPEQGNTRDYIKKHVDTLHHYAGTCQMGNEENKFSVVDGQLKVYGVQNLRVIDASVFPTVPAGQICVPVIACAERAADLILEYNQ